MLFLDSGRGRALLLCTYASYAMRGVCSKRTFVYKGGGVKNRRITTYVVIGVRAQKWGVGVGCWCGLIKVVISKKKRTFVFGDF